MSPLDRVIELAGGQSRLAASLKVKPQAVQQWRAAGRLPAKRVVPAAAAVNFLVTPHELEPALYPNPADGIPKARA